MSEQNEKYGDSLLQYQKKTKAKIYCCHADKYERLEDSPPVRHFGLNYPCNLWNCAPGADIIVCGKEIRNKCRNGNRRFYWFKNPGTEEIEAVKRLLGLEKKQE